MRRSQFQKLEAEESIDVALSRDVSSQYDNVKKVADEIAAVVTVADNIEVVGVVAGDLPAIISDIIPSLGEILAADTNAAVATAKAAEASASEAMARKWADEAEDMPVVGTVGVDDEYSAYHWAKKAEAFMGDVTLDSLYDVYTTGVINKQVLRYDAAGTADKKWVASTVDKAYIGLGNVDNTADVNKVVASAGKWTTARTLTLSGDVTGSASIDGSANVSMTTTVADNSHAHDNSTITNVDWSKVSNKPDPVVTVTLTGDVTGTGNVTLTDVGNGTVTVAATIAPNSVALGADTTGNYVAGVTAGSGIVVTGTAGEGWSPTVAHADTSSQASVDNSAGNVIQDVTVDTYGHVTAIGSTNLDDRYLSALGGIMDLGLITEAIG